MTPSENRAHPMQTSKATKAYSLGADESKPVSRALLPADEERGEGRWEGEKDSAVHAHMHRTA